MAAMNRTTLSILHESLVTVMRQLENCNGDSDSLDSILYRIDWLYSAIVRYLDVNDVINGEVVNLLREARDHLFSLCDVCDDSYEVQKVTSGRRGRPKFNISREQLTFLLEKGFSLPSIARVLSVSLRTVERRLQQFGMSKKMFYTDIDDQRLDNTIRDLSSNFPSAGYYFL